MNILSLQSSVVQGHVGNSAAAFILERLGFEVWALDTITLAHHPGHGPAPGRLAEPAELTALLDGIAARGAFASCDALLSGYLGDAALGAPLLDAVARMRAANPHGLYCCCPVIGDGEKGIYVRPGIPEFLRDAALPRADIAILNRFELGWLAGREIAEAPEALAAARGLSERGPARIVVTGLRERGRGDAMGALLLERSKAWLCTAPLVAAPASGAGDAFAALFLGHLLREGLIPEGDRGPRALAAAVTAMHAIMTATAAADANDLALIAAQDAFDPDPKRLFKPLGMG